MRISITAPTFPKMQKPQLPISLDTEKIKAIVSIPVIYSMTLPIIMIDLTTTLYQQIIFRLYEIPLVKRKDYIIIDRHYLNYLKPINKVNCVYCGYGNGVAAYVQEIIARTEEKWCPIKHAQPPKETHRHYEDFLPYGDAEKYRQKSGSHTPYIL